MEHFTLVESQEFCDQKLVKGETLLDPFVKIIPEKKTIPDSPKYEEEKLTKEEAPSSPEKNMKNDKITPETVKNTISPKDKSCTGKSFECVQNELVREEVRKQLAEQKKSEHKKLWKEIMISVGAGLLIGFGAGRVAR